LHGDSLAASICYEFITEFIFELNPTLSRYGCQDIFAGQVGYVINWMLSLTKRPATRQRVG